MKRILILGSGFVAEPVMEYLSRNPENQITIASNVIEDAQKIAEKYPGTDYKFADVADSGHLKSVIQNHDVVISLVPAVFHTLVAEICIQCQVNMLTASYESDEMRRLQNNIKDSGIFIMNEMGLDPGIDHLAAMKIIDKVHKDGDEVESFVSWCGGIPAVNDNPLGYKFSWEPRGAILVLLNEAVYLLNNQKHTISGKDLMKWSRVIDVSGLKLECYPNRESTHYKDVYNIPQASDIIRGTLRYRGFCNIFQDVKNLGLMQTDRGGSSHSLSWIDYILKLNPGLSIDDLKSSVNPDSLQALEWLGIFSDERIAMGSSAIDIFCNLLLTKLSYKNNESDMVVLQHKFVIKRKNGSHYFISSTLKQTGNPEGYSAMAKTVGYPIAMATELLLKAENKTTGLILPMNKDIYYPVLELLAHEGIEFVDEIMEENSLSKKEFLCELY